MSLLSQASLVVVPSGYKEDVVYSVKPTDGSGDLTFTRASDGTRVNSQGLVERVPWNLLQYSEDYNTGWSKVRYTSTGNSTTAPNGTNTASLIDDGTATGQHLIERKTEAIAGAGISISIYAKYIDTQYLFFATYDTSYNGVCFDIQNGSVGNNTTGSVGTIESVGNGWFRCSVYYAANTRLDPWVSFGLRDDNTAAFENGAGANRQAYVWGAQAVIGSTAKPYFPTTDRLNVPRLDYSNGCPSLLLEPQRTNLYPYSEDLSQWTTSGSVTVTANDATSPDGTTNADRVQFSADTDMVYYSGTGSAGTNVVSVYAKAKSGTAQKFRFFVNGATLYSSDLTATDQWQRFDFVYTYSAQTVGLRGATTGASDVLFWGFQHEIGSYPTSYIPTTSASVTRVADAASIDPSSFLGTTQGSWFMELNDLTFEVSGTSVPTNWLGLDVANCLAIEGRAAGQGKNIYFVKEESNVVTTLTTKVISGTLKACFVWNGTSLKCFVNGVKEYDASGFTQPSSWSTLEYNYSGREAQQLINQTILFPTSLTDAEAIALTTL